MSDFGVSVVELSPADSPEDAAVSAGGLLLQAVKQKAQRDSRKKSLGTEGGCLQTVTKMVLLAPGARVRAVYGSGCESHR